MKESFKLEGGVLVECLPLSRPVVLLVTAELEEQEEKSSPNTIGGQ
jgi:hypothetical protein